jgi:circadian clock protein KaiC
MGTGVAGLDDVLGGGLTTGRLYLIEGSPGAGKTTIALQFLIEGVARGESVLYVTLSETETELLGVAASHGWSLDGIHMREMLPSQESLQPDEQYTMFHPSEVELSETTHKILLDVEKLKPTRVVFDSLSELRLLAGHSLRYRRQILALKQFFAGRDCTVLMLDDMTSMQHDLQVQSIAHAVLRLEQLNSDYGAARRRLVVVKYRGRDFRGGFRLQDRAWRPGGFSASVAAEHAVDEGRTRLALASPRSINFSAAGWKRNKYTLSAPRAPASLRLPCSSRWPPPPTACAALFIFDESIKTLLTLRRHGHEPQTAHRLRPDHGAPGRPRNCRPANSFTSAGRSRSTGPRSSTSLNGYLNAMPNEQFLIIQLHELLTFGQSGVATLLIGAQHGLIGMQMQTPVDASYLADAVVILRYFEAGGMVRQAISVLKKRGGAHERSIRDFSLSSSGIHVGQPLRQFRGILTGVPIALDDRDSKTP